MTNELIAPSKLLGYSDIFLDFLAGSEPARSFYLATSVAAVADQLDTISFDRERMIKILTRQNKLFGASAKTLEKIQTLRDPRAVCIFSGQQAGLLGGPMLTLIKALAIVKAAESYTQKLDRPVIPIFWIAGDDHDFEEANHTFLLDQHGDLQRIAYETPPEFAVPTAEILFADEAELNRLKDAVKESLGQTDFTNELYALIDKSYGHSDTMVSAFGKLMTSLTAEFGLPLFSPGDSEAKHHAIPIFKQIIERQDEIHSLLSERNSSISSNGYHIQVEKSDDATHLFCNCNGRHPIKRDGNNFNVDGKSYSKKDILEWIEKEPERFSPDVMTRPILQSYLFPTASQKGGPSEIAYLAQINPLFKLFDLPAPYYCARATLTLVEKRFEKLMHQHEITIEELSGDVEQVINRILAKSFPHDLDEGFIRFRRHLQTHFEDFVSDSLSFDPSLNRNAEQTFGKVDFAIKAFEKKVFSSHKKKSKDARDRIYRLSHALCPNRGFQERSLNISCFISRHGLGVVQYMYDCMDSEEKSHQMISLSGMNNKWS